MRWFLIAVAATMALAACSNGSSAGAYGGGSTSTSSSSSSAPMAAEAAISTANVDGVGTVLVDGNGMTLYLFESDTGPTSTCTASCATTWPALTSSGAPTVTGKADASMLGTSARDDGTKQVTYNGHPLYLYSGDTAQGQVNGEGIGGVWFAVTSDGSAAQATSSSKGGGYGNGYGGG
jgi:predicted lipoprotein with Yx(FWY)xxD motif